MHRNCPRHWKLFFVAAAFVALPHAASSAIITYTDRTNWQNAVQVSGSENFNAFAADTAIGAAPQAVGNLTISGSTLSGLFVDVSPFDSLGGTVSPDVDGTPVLNVGGVQAGNEILISTGVAMAGIGFDWKSFDDHDDDFGIRIDGMDIFTNASDEGDTGFLGFVTDMGTFTSISIIFGNSDGGSFYFGGFDNFEFAETLAAVPEPGTLALFGLGLAGLGFARRRKAT